MRHDELSTLLMLLRVISPLVFLGIGPRTLAMWVDTLGMLLSLLQVFTPLAFLGIWSWINPKHKGQPSRSRTTSGPGRIDRPGRPDSMWDPDLDAQDWTARPDQDNVAIWNG